MVLLEVKNLCVRTDGKDILKDFNLKISAGEVHAIMGPNGTGKSTLAYVLSGSERYHVTAGQIFYKNIDLLELSVEERAHEGIFLAFQHPVEIPGITISTFMRHALNAKRAHQKLPEISTLGFVKILRAKAEELHIDADILKRAVNVGFSGGEKKRMEALQMAILEPTLAVLDEPDSGLDIDSIRIMAAAVNRLHNTDNAVLLVTHYQRLLEYIVPDFVHIMVDGSIKEVGGYTLALSVEKDGYGKYV